MAVNSTKASKEGRPVRRQGEHTQPKLSQDALTKFDCVRTIAQTAQILGIGEPSLRQIIDRGERPRVTRLSERRLGIRDSHREAWLDAQEEQPGSDSKWKQKIAAKRTKGAA
jgi:hypothetical protein